MVPELPTLNPCPRCHAANVIYKCVVQDGVLTFMLRPACPDCGFTTDDVFVTETRAASAWNAIVPEPVVLPEPPSLEQRYAQPSAGGVKVFTRRDPQMSEGAMTPERLAEIEAAGDAADIPELVAEIRRLRRDFFGHSDPE